MKFKQIIVLFLVISMFIIPTDGSLHAKTILVKNLSSTKKILYVGDQWKLSTTVSKSKIRFSSSNTSVATIDNTGKVKANKIGKSTLTVWFLLYVCR